MSDEVIFKPGREFSAIHIALTPELDPVARTDEALIIWTKLAEAFPENAPEEPRARGAEEQGGSDATGPTAAPAQASRGSNTGVWCKDHRVELIQSKYAIDKKNEYDSFYHPLAQPGADGQKNCNLWFRQTVDVNGNSNDGQPLPATVKQPPVDAVQQAANRYDDDPGPDEPNW